MPVAHPASPSPHARVSNALRRAATLFTLALAFSAPAHAGKIKSVSPGDGTDGTQIVILGSGLGGKKAPTVTLKSRSKPKVSRKLRVKSFKNNRIIALVPELRAGDYDLIVKPKGKGKSMKLAKAFTVKLPTKLRFGNKPLAIGDYVVARGDYLGAEPAKVIVGDTEVPVIKWNAKNEKRGTFTFQVPERMSNGLYDVTLQTTAGEVVIEEVLLVRDDPLKVVSAAPTSNTEVLVQFTKALLPEGAENPLNYRITGSIAPGMPGAMVMVIDAELLGPDNMTVRLTTLSQSDLFYTLSAINLRDEAGNPLAAPEGEIEEIEPSTAHFVGIAPGGASDLDADRDGLTDADEQRGWIVVVHRPDGGTESHAVTSDPMLADTDGDGVTDNEEAHARTDPRSPDTDHDTLTDNNEWNQIFSDPTHQDTDGDGVQDGFEFYSFRTSPLLADTDGDQIIDGDEIAARNRNPRIADLPRPRISVGDVRLTIDERYTYEDVSGNTVSSESSSTSTLSQSENTSLSTSDTDVTEKMASLGVTKGVESGTEDGKPVSKASKSISGGLQYTDSHTQQITRESAQESQRVYEDSIAKGRELSTTSAVTREVFGARIDVDLTIQNAGDIAFTVSNIEVTVLHRGRGSNGRFLPVGTLIANSQLITGAPASFNLGPFTRERGPIVFSSRDVFPSLVEQLMAAPGGLIFKVANFDVTDELGRNFTFSNQTARDRTAGIIVDYGDGTVERFLVATALQPDSDEITAEYGPDGRPVFVGGFDGQSLALGIPLDFALQDILRLRKNAPATDGIVAGRDGYGDSIALGDDVQIVIPGTGGLLRGAMVVGPGPDGVLDSFPDGDDEAVTSQLDGIVAGPDKMAESIAQGDDVQVVPPDTTGLAPSTIVVSAGEDGILESFPGGDDETLVTRGYETSRSCDASADNAGALCTSDAQCDFGTCSGPEVLVRVGSARDGSYNRQWVVLSNDNLPAGADFGRITLKPGKDIFLAFVQDLDKDGIYAREEYLAGSVDSSADRYTNADFRPWIALENMAEQPDGKADSKDTDRDRIGDYAELRVGWKVDVDGTLVQVYPDPRRADSDGDGIYDTNEQEIAVNECRWYRQDPRPFCRNALDYGTRASGTDISIGVDGEYVGTIRSTSTDLSIFRAGDSVALECERADPSDYCFSGGLKIVDTPSANELTLEFGVPYEPAGRSRTLTLIVTDPPTASDPTRADTDSDGLGDYDELVGFYLRDAIVDGGNRRSDSLAVGDDVQKVQVGYRVLPGGIVVLPGNDQDIDSIASGDDVFVGGEYVVTDPLRRDTDYDLITDGREVAVGSDPTDSNDGDEFVDSDQDGLIDAEETELGWLISVNGGAQTVVYSNPTTGDTDRDGLPDYVEREIGSNPTSADTDGDTLSDYDEFEDFEAYAYLADLYAGFSIDGSRSARLGTTVWHSDIDADQRTDRQELDGYKLWVLDEDTPRHIVTDPNEWDTDFDGLGDSYEQNITRTDPTDSDTDDDGRSDFHEDRMAGTDPLVPDIGIKVTFANLLLNNVPDAGGSGGAEVGWWFLVQRPGATTPTLVSHAGNTSVPPTLNLYFLTGATTSCLLFGDVASYRHYNIVLGRLATLSLKPGETFRITGLLAELDEGATDCGLAPNYIPSWVQSGCVTRFNETYSYEDFVAGGRAIELVVDGRNTAESCDWQVEVTVEVQ